MSNQKKFTVAVVGATGAVGEQMIHLLDQRNFPIERLKLLASARSIGKKVLFRGIEHIVEEATPESFRDVEIALFSAGSSISQLLAPIAAAAGVVCMDNTSAFRMDAEVPLIVPEVNIDKINEHKGIIANPNYATIQIVTALKPLQDKFGISRVIVSTYQAVSDHGFTFEEMKIVQEIQKILGDDHIEVKATCVRIPVARRHSESVYVELKNDFQLDEVKQLLADAPRIVLVEYPMNEQYPLAIDCEGKLDVFVGRVCKDQDHPRGINMWIVSDNLLQGAAWNMVQIAEYIALER